MLRLSPIASHRDSCDPLSLKIEAQTGTVSLNHIGRDFGMENPECDFCVDVTGCNPDSNLTLGMQREMMRCRCSFASLACLTRLRNGCWKHLVRHLVPLIIPVTNTFFTLPSSRPSSRPRSHSNQADQAGLTHCSLPALDTDT